MEWSGRWSVIFCKQNATQESAKVGTPGPVILGGAVAEMFSEKLSCNSLNMCMTKKLHQIIF